MFGALLEEWADRRVELPDAPQRALVTSELCARALRPVPATDHAALFDALLPSLALESGQWPAQLQKTATELLAQPVEPDEARYVLQALRAEPMCSAALREEAARIVASDMLCREFADALTLLIGQRAAWDWPLAGVPAQARWSRTKWRLFLDDDLPNACLLEVLGLRWQMIFHDVLGDLQQRQGARIRRLQELHAPAILLEHERSRLDGRGAGPGPVLGIWDGDSAAADSKDEWGYASVLRMRSQALQELRDAWERNGYGGVPYASMMPQALMLINAEITLGRAAFPDRPLYILKLDLQDYYPSLSHALLRELLERIGVPESERSFFARYLSTPIAHAGAAQPSARGLPNSRCLSDALGELLLRLLDMQLRRTAWVLVVRMLDDICLLGSSAEEIARAWAAVQSFCASCGLTLNLEKCGAVCLGGALPPGLPAGPVTWQLLALDADGMWRVHAPALERFLAHTRWQIGQAAAVLSKIEIYNQQLALLTSMLAPAAPLGPEHRASVDAALARYQAEVFGEGQSALAAVHALVHARFLSERGAALPEAWFCWPITAGGIGIMRPGLLSQPYARAAEERRAETPADRPADWQRQNGAWGNFYAAQLRALEPEPPDERAVMEALVSDFIARGAEITDGKQDDLSAYWRWLLYTYGPQILESFGTFRFLETALVPQQLIVERQLGETEASALLALAPPV